MGGSRGTWGVRHALSLLAAALGDFVFVVECQCLKFDEAVT